MRKDERGREWGENSAKSQMQEQTMKEENRKKHAKKTAAHGSVGKEWERMLAINNNALSIALLQCAVLWAYGWNYGVRA